ncbi:hypothetical protein BVY03_01335, partial [bacterium K02(2017)]
MTNSINTPSKNKVYLTGFTFFLLAVLFASYLHWIALNCPYKYKSDIRQSIHHASNHQTSFKPNDLLISYTAFNEGPFLNLTFYIGPYIID